MTISKKKKHQTQNHDRDFNSNAAIVKPDDLEHDGLLLLVAVAVLGIVYTVIERLFSPIYGSTAVALSRPTGVILLPAALVALKPTGHGRCNGPIYLAAVGCFWAVLLCCSDPILRYDQEATLPIAVGIAWTLKRTVWAIEDPSVIVPVLASSTAELFFTLPLIIAITSMIRQTSRKTGIPAIVLICALAAAGSATLSITAALTKAYHIYWLLAVLIIMPALFLHSYRCMLWIYAFAILAVLALLSTTTYSCKALPNLLNCRMHDSGFIIKDSVESITGRITVLENDKYRLLKADHSLLGGEWIGDAADQSIFSAFYMQSLAIYALDPGITHLDMLQIGLGMGTATKTILQLPRFNKENVKVDIVELDRAVLEYAHKHFSVPRALDDARVSTHVMNALDFIQSAEPDRYNLISHDIFTGGAVAYPLFTSQFFTSLKRLLSAGGILTVNFVWAPASNQETFHAVAITLRSLFKHVTAFVENGRVEPLNNVLFMCSDAPIHLSIPDSGRTPISVLGMTARNMKDWEYVKLDDLKYDASLILMDRAKDGGRSYERVHGGDVALALKHWSLMRSVLSKDESNVWRHL